MTNRIELPIAADTPHHPVTGTIHHRYTPAPLEPPRSRAMAKKNGTSGVDVKAVVAVLNRLLELELAGVVRFNHYALMVFGHARIPIVDWMRTEATEAMGHAQKIGEWITALGEHPSLKIGPLLETHRHAIDDILKEVLEHEAEGLEVYR